MTQINRNVQPGTGIPEKIKFIDPEKVFLDNGIPVYLVNNGLQDLVKIDLIFKAGTRYGEKVLLPVFTNKLLLEGTNEKSSLQISEIIDYYGAHIDPDISKDMAYLSLYSLNKNLNEMIPLLAEILHEPAFSDDELQILKKNLKQDFIIDSEKVKYQARRRFNEIIFGADHPYGKLYEENDFEMVSQLEISEFHNKKYSNQDLTILVSGKLPENILSLLNQYFGSGEKVENIIDRDILSEIDTPDNLKHFIKKENALQSAIRIGRSIVNKSHPDNAGLKVLNTILGGYFGSRLMTNIREDKGYTYGIGSAMISLNHGGYFFIASEVGNNVTSLALKEVNYELDRLRQNRVPEHELNLVKNYMLGSFMRNIDSVFVLSESIKNLIEYDLNSDFQYKFVEKIKQITAEEIRDLAQKYFDEKDLVQLIVGN